MRAYVSTWELSDLRGENAKEFPGFNGADLYLVNLKDKVSFR